MKNSSTKSNSNCKVVTSNYVVLALIPSQIWLQFLQSFSLYVCGINCKGWVWEIGEDSCFKGCTSGFRDWFATVLWAIYPRKKPRVEHMTERWRVMPGCIFCECLARKANLRRTRKTFCLVISYVLLYHVFTHTIYTLITHKW